MNAARILGEKVLIQEYLSSLWRPFAQGAYCSHHQTARCLPLPARDERGEGWGEGFGNTAATC